MVGLLSRDDGSIGNQREVDPGVGHQVGLELIQIHIQGSIKSQGRSDGRDNLADKPVKVGVGRALNIKISPADIIDGLIVDHEGAVRVLQGSMSTESGVVGLNHSSGHLKHFISINMCTGTVPIMSTSQC
jgi:hypothetical protein